ncbi:RNA-directed DNA polymerase, eukaryota [Tanacetum coccineum]
MGDRRSFNSKKDLTQKISKSVFVTNFPDHFSARDLWNVCVAYGKVIDVYIPVKKSKAGKKFAFVRFVKIGRLRLHANVVRFQREVKATPSQPKKGIDGVSKNSFASILKSANHVHSSSHESVPAIVLDDSCLKENDFSCSLMGKVKDINVLANLHLTFANEGFENVKLSYFGGYWVLIESVSMALKEKISNHVGVASFWNDVWLSESPLKQCFPRLFALKDDKIVLVFDKLNDPSLIESFRRTPRGVIEDSQLNSLAENLAGVILTSQNDT